MFRIALKSTLARKWRLATTGLAIVISVAFITGTLLVTNLIDSTLGSLISEAYKGIDTVVRSTNVQKSQFGSDDREAVPARTVDLVRGAKGVRAAEGVVQGFMTLVDRKGERIQSTPAAVAPRRPTRL
jgi:putative ABC transport system permease protein